MKHPLLFVVSLLLTVSALFAADKAPDFTAKDLDGQVFNLKAALEKGPVLLDFWADWCKPCKKALPHVEAIRKAWADSGLQVLTISIDSPKTQARIAPYVKSQGYGFRVLLDPNAEVRQLFGGKDIPFTVLIDRDGAIVFQHLGYKSGDEAALEAAVKDALIVHPSPFEAEPSQPVNEESDK